MSHTVLVTDYPGWRFQKIVIFAQNLHRPKFDPNLTQYETHSMTHTKWSCDTNDTDREATQMTQIGRRHISNRKGDDTNDTDRKVTQLGKHKRFKTQKNENID